ncbi:transporter, peptide-acetyl-coenzyme A transporter (PAT) family [Hyphomonas neptunium ATCC 15444]|uniref:Transporter, peptide-acetyl-coenzyme A transporter (PAT) family n=2 Tax=Hyphomonas TaxID=85 RepID=Q0C5C6_HYPNA|nr:MULTISPECIES: MFS transporter [Hyphomonas]ABI76817.1 transporter, peptide-acetyl-coenzyme A transporter (PAT) family [Hyphomonas neptunium ATCC 15444]KCZ95500.1 peptide-acetyl-coenzyme A transporter (PAT) family protein [Hyphomonas hirschiana VP5]
MADIVTGQDEPVQPKAGLREVLVSLRQPKVAIAMVFGIATGMPPVMVGVTLGYWMREEGVALTAIGFMGWVGIFIATKFLWAPFVDWIRLPIIGKRLGHRRSWMLLGQIFVTVGILGMAFTGPSAGLAVFAGFAMLTSFAAATQDIAVDAWRIESALDEEQDLMASAYILGLRSGYFFGNVPILAASGIIGWQAAYAFASLGGLAGLSALLLAREPQKPRDFAPLTGIGSVGSALIRPLKVFWQDHGTGLFIFLPLVALFFLPDSLIVPMVGPLYIDLGFSTGEIAGMRTVIGFPATLGGVVAAGLIGMRLGTLTAMAIGVTLAGLSNLGFCMLALSGGSKLVWAAVTVVEGFSGGLAMAAIVAWASRLTNPIATAAQFALLSSLMSFLGGFLGGFAGLGVVALQGVTGSSMGGFAAYFSLSPFAIIPPLILIWMVRQRMKRMENAALP